MITTESLTPEEREVWQLRLLKEHLKTKLLIKYELASGPLQSHRVECCGYFKNQAAFETFKEVEATYNRHVLWSRIIEV